MIKKLIIVMFGFTLLLGCATNDEREEIVLTQCVDGDTARFENLGRVRFLYIDTPELNPTPQPFAQEAADFTCDMLKNANHIYIEYDGRKEDDYGRVLGWIWVDDKLLQEEIVMAGYVNRFYNYNHVKYKDRIDRAYQKAKQNKVGLFE
jgi:micrococcal nuclease